MDTLKGLLFALLWASATVATKFAVRSAEPFLLTAIRFPTVSLLLLSYIYVFKRSNNPLPSTGDIGKLTLLGILNVTLYISGFLIAIRHVSAGLISLVTATNPLILILMSAILSKRKLQLNEWMGMIVSLTGLALAAVPNLKDPHATIIGVTALIIGIIALSAGSVYYSRSKLALPKMVVNAWQITLGGILFVPIAWLDSSAHYYLKTDVNFFLSLGWLVGPVSVIGYALWLQLLHKDAVKAGLWLFLTPAIGYFMATIFLHEPLTWFGIAGTLLVVGGLFLARKKPSAINQVAANVK